MSGHGPLIFFKMKPKAKNCNTINAKMNEEIDDKKDPSDLEILADLICLELKDDAKMLYASKRGMIRELKCNINMLQSVLNGQDRKRLKDLSFN
jgi:hypothetical protein